MRQPSSTWFQRDDYNYNNDDDSGCRDKGQKIITKMGIIMNLHKEAPDKKKYF